MSITVEENQDGSFTVSCGNESVIVGRGRIDVRRRGVVPPEGNRGGVQAFIVVAGDRMPVRRNSRFLRVRGGALFGDDGLGPEATRLVAAAAAGKTVNVIVRMKPGTSYQLDSARRNLKRLNLPQSTAINLVLGSTDDQE